MENKTLLTVVALLLAGFVTIMLARGSDENHQENAFNNSAGESPAADVWQENAAANHWNNAADSDGQFSYANYAVTQRH